MPQVDDLRFIGAPVGDAVMTAKFIGGLVLTKRQKAQALREYLLEKGISINEEIRKAAESYIEAF